MENRETIAVELKFQEAEVRKGIKPEELGKHLAKKPHQSEFVISALLLRGRDSQHKTITAVCGGKTEESIKLFIDVLCRVEAEIGITLNPLITATIFRAPRNADHAAPALSGSISKTLRKLPISRGLIHTPEDRISGAQATGQLVETGNAR
jgi:hypothetical protein